MKRGSIFETDGIPRMSEALPLAMQHVVAMIVGCVTPAIIVSGAVPGGLSREDQVILIQSALVIAALSTLLQLFPIGGKAKFAIGSGLPIIMGVSFAYVPSMQAIAESYGIAAIMGAEIVGGVVAVVMGLLVKKIRVFFPPLIMECHLWQCIGSTDSIIWSADTMTFTECRCQTLHLMYADTPIAVIWRNRE